MNTNDLFDDSWPYTHGTVQGYDEGGCRASICPAGTEYGLSCKTAKQMSRNNYQYQRLAKEGLTVAEIADRLGLVGTEAAVAPAPKKSRAGSKQPTATKKPTPATARGGMSIADAKQPAPGIPVESDKVTEKYIPLDHPDVTARAEEILQETAEKLAGAETTAPAPKAATTAEVRAWAKDRGYDLKDHGRIPAHIRQHFDEAHAAGTADSITAQIAHNLDTAAPTEAPADTVTAEDQPQEPAAAADPDTDLDAARAALAAEKIHPDSATVTLTEDLARVTEERDRARRTAVHLEQELARAESEVAGMINDVFDANVKVGELEEQIESTPRWADIDRDTTIENLREQLAAENTLRETAERAVGLAVQKWGEERANNEAAHALIIQQAHSLNTALAAAVRTRTQTPPIHATPVQASEAIIELGKAGVTVDDMLLGALEATLRLTAIGMDPLEAAHSVSSSIAKFGDVVNAMVRKHEADLITPEQARELLGIRRYDQSIVDDQRFADAKPHLRPGLMTAGDEEGNPRSADELAAAHDLQDDINNRRHRPRWMSGR
ncbi:Lsr2 family DNA-binding protein [Microbacterium maritypicum]